MAEYDETRYMDTAVAAFRDPGGARDGHTGAVTGVAFDPAGEHLATACADGMLRIWSMAGSEPIAEMERELKGHPGSVDDVRWSGAGDLIATSGGNHIALWDAAQVLAARSNPQPVHRLAATSRRITAMDFSSDGAYLAWAADDGRLQVTGMGPGRPCEFSKDGARYRAIAFSPDEAVFAAGDDDGRIELFARSRTGAWRAQGRVGRSGEPIEAIAWSPDGCCVVATRGGAATVWTIESLKLDHPVDLEGPSLGERLLFVQWRQFPGLGEAVVAGCDDEQLRVWTDPTGTPEHRVWPSPNGVALCADWSPMSQRLAVGCHERTAVVATTSPTQVDIHLRCPEAESWVTDFVAGRTGSPVFVSRSDGAIDWLDADAASGTAASARLREGSVGERVRAMALSDDGGRLAVALRGASLPGVPRSERIVFLDVSAFADTGGDSSAGRPRAAESACSELLPARATRIAFSPDGRQLAVGCVDGRARVLDAQTARVIASPAAGPGVVNAVAWAREPGQGAGALALGTSGGTVRILPEPLRPTTRSADVAHVGLDAVESLVWSAAVSGRPPLLFCGTADCAITVVDTVAKEPIATLLGHLGAVDDVQVTADGQALVSSSADGHLRVWRVADRDLYVSIPGFDGFPRIVRDPAAGAARVNVLALDTQSGLQSVTLDVARMMAEPPGDTLYYRNAKVALIGEGRAGKTGLFQRLCLDTWAPSEESHGLSVLPFPSMGERTRRGPEDPDTAVEEVFVWDLAGQPHFRLGHQLQLGGISVALHVVDAEDPLPDLEQVPYWCEALKQARLVAGWSAVPLEQHLIVARADAVADPARLDGAVEAAKAVAHACGLDQVLVTSARDEDGIAALRALIAESIAWERLPLMSSTADFETLRRVLRPGTRERREKPLYAMGDLLRNLRAQGLEDATVVDSLLRLAEAQGLGRRVSVRGSDAWLTEPELIDGLVASVVEVARANPLASVAARDITDGTIPLGPDAPEFLSRATNLQLREIAVADMLRYHLAFEDGPNLVLPVVFIQGADGPEPSPWPVEHEVTLYLRRAVELPFSHVAVAWAHTASRKGGGAWSGAHDCFELALTDGGRVRLGVIRDGDGLALGLRAQGDTELPRDAFNDTYVALMLDIVMTHYDESASVSPRRDKPAENPAWAPWRFMLDGGDYVLEHVGPEGTPEAVHRWSIAREPQQWWTLFALIGERPGLGQAIDKLTFGAAIKLAPQHIPFEMRAARLAEQVESDGFLAGNPNYRPIRDSARERDNGMLCRLRKELAQVTGGGIRLTATESCVQLAAADVWVPAQPNRVD